MSLQDNEASDFEQTLEVNVRIIVETHHQSLDRHEKILGDYALQRRRDREGH